MTLFEWPTKLLDTLAAWIETKDAQNRISLIVSPDFDGALSTMLLCEYVAREFKHLRVEVAGVYDVKTLFLVKDTNRDMHAVARRALWLDHDMFQNLLCIGNHLISVNRCEKFPSRNAKSFNLNLLAEQSWADSFHGSSSSGGRDKCMFSTSTVLAYALHNDRLVQTFKDGTQVQLPPRLAPIFAWLAHADSFWSSALIYKKSLHAWLCDAFDKGSVPNWLACMKGYCENDLAYVNHSNLIHTIQNAYRAECNGTTKMCKSDETATQASKSDVPMRWRGMLKQQTLGFNRDKTPLQRFMAMCNLIADTEKDFFSLFRGALTLDNIDAPLEHLVGQVRERNPTEWHKDCEEVHHRTKRRCLEQPWLICDAIADEEIISLAIVNRRTIKYTIDLPLRKDSKAE